MLAETVALIAFAVFSTLVLKEPLRWRDTAAFALILSGVVVAMSGRGPAHAVYEPAAATHPPPSPVPGGGRGLKGLQLANWTWIQKHRQQQQLRWQHAEQCNQYRRLDGDEEDGGPAIAAMDSSGAEATIGCVPGEPPLSSYGNSMVVRAPAGQHQEQQDVRHREMVHREQGNGLGSSEAAETKAAGEDHAQS